MDHGSVFKRCGCRDQHTGRLLGARCPKLGSSRHGSWYFSADLPSATRQRRRVRRGGFASRAAAAAALDVLTSPAAGEARGLTTGEWLQRWLASRVSLRALTSRGYAAHVRGYLVPYLGCVLLAESSAADVQHTFTAIARGDAALGHPVSAATLHRIHATLRAALNAAVRAGLITANPGRWPELPPAATPRPQVWTPALTERCSGTGGGPPGRPRPFLTRCVGTRCMRFSTWSRCAACAAPRPLGCSRSGCRDLHRQRAAAATRRTPGRRAAGKRRGAARDRTGPEHYRGAA